MMRTLAFILLVGMTAACVQGEEPDHREKYSAELEQIEELRVQLKEAQEMFLDVDTLKAKEAAEAYDRNTRLLGQYYIADSVDTSFARIMSSYKVLKGGKGIYQVRTKVRNEVKFTKKNLKALEENIIAGKFDDAKIKQYLKEEKDAVSELVLIIENSSKAANKAAETYEKLNPKVEEVVEEYRNQGTGNSKQ